MLALRHVLGALCVSVVAAAVPLQAQERSGLEFSFGAGAGAPSGNFNKDFDLGWHGQAAVSYSWTKVPVGVQVDGNFSRFGAGGSLDVKDELIYGTADLFYQFRLSESMLEPYAIAGGGVYHMDATGVDAAAIPSRTRTGLNGGLGLAFQPGSMKFFFETRYHNVFNGLPGDLDLKFVNFTLGLRLGK